MSAAPQSAHGAQGLALEDVRKAAAALAGRVVRTPTFAWPSSVTSALTSAGRIHCKLENLQLTGSFKARGALYAALSQPDACANGLTTFSAGNHAIATAFAAREAGVTAKAVMAGRPAPSRIDKARSYGAQLLFADSGAEAVSMAEAIVQEEARLLVHPFDDPAMVAGAGTIALEMLEDIEGLEALVVAVGGGGLAAGVAATIKQILPACEVYGVEPETADNLRQSLDAGEALQRAPRPTIADSLAPPLCLPYSFGLCRTYLDDVALVSDAQIIDAMRLWFETFGLPLEPAGAATTAALLGPLRARLEGKNVGLIICGANIDPAAFQATIRT